MAVTLDLSGNNMVIRIMKDPKFEATRDSIKKLRDKRPIYAINESGNSVFKHWEVPLSELGNLIDSVGIKEILPISDKSKKVLEDFKILNTALDELPKYEGEITWKRVPKYPEQEDYIRISPLKQRLILAPSPGLGKSYLSLMRAQILGAKKVLVVGPSKNNFVTWRGEVEKTTDWSFIKYHGTPQKRKKIRETEIHNYNVVYTTYTVMHELADIQFDQIILDEAHIISNPKTKLFKNAKKIVLGCNPEAGLQLLSGTPINHKPKDFWALVYLIDPKLAGDKYAWDNRYEKVIESIIRKIPIKVNGEYQKDATGKVMTRKIEIPIQTAPQNQEHLRNLIKPHMFRLKRDKYVSFKDTLNFEYVELTKVQKELYRQAKEELFLDLSTGQLKLSSEKLGRVTRFLQICEGGFNVDPNIIESSKLDYLFDILDNIEEKVIIWSRFKPITWLIAERYKDAVVYNGECTQNQKDLAIWNFQGCETKTDHSDWERLNKGQFERPGMARILAGTIDRGCTAGLNLDKARKQFFPSFSWNHNYNEQTASRIKRLNQMADEVETTIILSDTKFEEGAIKLVLNNYATTLGILDGREDVSFVQIEQLIGLI